MKYVFAFLMLTGLALQPSEKEGEKKAMLVRETDIHFEPSEAVYQEKVQVYTVLLDKDLQPVYQQHGDSFSFYEDGLPLDMFEYWQQKGNERYYVLLTKTAFIITKPIGFFNETLLSNPQYIQRTLPEYKIQTLDDQTFRIDCGFFAPSFTYDLQFYRSPYPAALTSLAHKYFLPSQQYRQPALVAIQHNRDFSRVLLHKTSKMSVAISSYYDLGEGQTLCINHTLNYIHELPPQFLGGAELLVNEIEKGICDFVEQTRATCLAFEAN